jgi:hypothetical protein
MRDFVRERLSSDRDALRIEFVGSLRKTLTREILDGLRYATRRNHLPDDLRIRAP